MSSFAARRYEAKAEAARIMTGPGLSIRTTLVLSAALTAAAVTAAVETLLGKSPREAVVFSAELAGAALIAASLVASAFIRSVLVRRSLTRSLLLAVLALLATYPLFAIINTIVNGHISPGEIAASVVIVPVFALYSVPVTLPATLLLAGAWYFFLSRSLRDRGTQARELSPPS